MTGWLLPFSLNIRQKVIVGLVVSIMAVVAIAAISYYYLHQIELKQHVVEIADDLSNTTLEIRRYEKNYLLYGSSADLRENLQYLQAAQRVLDNLVFEGQKLKLLPQFDLMKKALGAYKETVDKIASLSEVMDQADRKKREALEEKLREHGKILVELSSQVVVYERQRILEILRTLKTQLLYSLSIFLVFGVFLTFIVSRKVIKPLEVIEKTTLRIAQGNFRPLPVLNTRDETQQVVTAFNRMIAELEKRQNQLVQIKKMSSLGVLTAGIAHQLNNPLNNISTSCQIVLEELDICNHEFMHKMLTNVIQEVHRARDIVKGLLEFSRVRDFSLNPTVLRDVIARAVRLVASQAPPGVEIIQQVPDDLILELDVQRMQEVFINLLLNATQAIEELPGQIKIAAWADEARQQAMITVEDTGVGIPPEALDKIFDPFFTTKEVGLGTGLGLSIAYGIVEKHRGTITVESKPGEGTRFTISLPLPPKPKPEPEVLSA
ncbi:ATP-binding protein [Desulfobacca acetoxidans]